jgi:2-succinyl-5-enolpyruvyl-6-hydroxy-3-cyclohexene-1-carboxylate synthase
LPSEASRVEKHLCKLSSHGVVILAEELSNIKQEYITNRYFDNVISQETGNNLRPDLIVTLGGHIVSKNLKQWLRKFHPQHH